MFFFLLNSPSSKALDVATQNLAAAIMGNTSCDPGPKFKVSGQILYFIANASNPEHQTNQLLTLDVHVSNMYRVNNVSYCKCISL